MGVASLKHKNERNQNVFMRLLGEGMKVCSYVDCPVKPCYLCKKSGHTAATCPFRLDPTLNVAPAAGTTSRNVAQLLLTREVSSVHPRQVRYAPGDG
jgi:hypothetical protein